MCKAERTGTGFRAMASAASYPLKESILGTGERRWRGPLAGG